MIIFLIGFMGSGKTTLGKRLARKLGYEFVDMDHYIENIEGMKVTEIFEAKGESYFRDLERSFLESLQTDKDLVIGTGGGSPCNGNNMDIMNSKGVTVYLKMSPVSLASRLGKARNIRPLIAGLQEWQLRDFIEDKLREREIFYNKAQCIIKGENVKPHHVISLVFGEEN